MKGDFSRDSFDVGKHFIRVLNQQGRVQLDADWNEQVSTLLHYLQTLAADLIGPHGAPSHIADSFSISPADDNLDFKILEGRYYVDGILCENEADTTYINQPDYPNPPPLVAGESYFVYLDVWERHLNALQDEAIAEPALGGMDTCSRSKLVWQVKVRKQNRLITNHNLGSANITEGHFPLRTNDLPVSAVSQVYLGASLEEPNPQYFKEPCLLPPESRYRGPENRLYRVEIHSGGEYSFNGESGDVEWKDGVIPTFKWSPDNGSVCFAIKDIQSDENGLLRVVVNTLGSGCEIALSQDDWVEIADDATELKGQPNSLFKVVAVDASEFTVILSAGKATSLLSNWINKAKHPILRKWHPKLPKRDKSPKLSEDNNALEMEFDKDLILENGLQIRFSLPQLAKGSVNVGDYWQIPARPESGTIIWPELPDNHREPNGVKHHYAPLAHISIGQDGIASVKTPLRNVFSVNLTAR